MTTDPKDAEIADLVAELTRAPGWPTLARRAVDTIKALTAELREARMQVIASDGQAQMAYEAQQKSEAECERWKELYDNKASDYATLYDETVGTPCASIRWQHEREDLTAERDAALAQVAEQRMDVVAMSEMAASLIEDMSKKPNTTWGQVKAAVRVLGDLGDRSALSRRDAQMRAEGMRKAAEIAYDVAHYTDDISKPRDAILAAAEKGNV